MKKLCLSIFILITYILNSTAQHFEVTAGPIYGHYTNKTKQFWMLVEPNNTITNDWSSQFNVDLHNYFSNRNYKIDQVDYSSIVLNKYVLIKGTIAPKETKDTIPSIAPDTLSFLVGSCAFPFPFGVWNGQEREKIFEQMLNHRNDFMVWMGDNVYYLFGEWQSKKKMLKKNVKMRLRPYLKAFLESCPQYAIWDDHDFGANNSDTYNPFKYITLDLFKKFWPNPSFGLDTVLGVFTNFRHEDAEFFMLDARFYCNKDSSELLGKQQMAWLQEKLLNSDANFKFIVSGTQMLAINPNGEDFGDYPKEKTALLNFIKQENISGVIFMSGDRHYAELNKVDRPDTYPLYEFTTSPLTSFKHPSPTKAKDNLYRVDSTLVAEQNFGKIIITDENGDRSCLMQIFDKKNQLKWEKKVMASELR